MNKIKKIMDAISYLWIVGLVGTILNVTILKYFYLLGILVIIKIIINFPLYSQAVLQLIGIPISLLFHSKKLSKFDSIISKNIYDLPFEGQWYIVNGGVTKEDSHSWIMISQRYAYDFVQIDDSTKTNKNLSKELDDYYCYRQNILSPAEGVIVELKNKYIDTPRLEPGQAGCNAKDVRGNYILIKHDNNEYSLLAHLLKDTFTVKVGDRVARGTIIAQCGNSGNTTEPHLHFHIQQGKSFYFSVGIPIRFSVKMTNNEFRFIRKESLISNYKV